MIISHTPQKFILKKIIFSITCFDRYPWQIKHRISRLSQTAGTGCSIALRMVRSNYFTVRLDSLQQVRLVINL